MIDQDRERALLRAVELYYYEGFTQAAISERLGCTRWTVGRLLREANDAGIVEITVHHDRARRHDLEKKLQEAYTLDAVRVIPTGPTPKESLGRIAYAASDFLTDIRPRPQVVSIGYGRTVGAIARSLPVNWNRGVTVVQLSAAPRQLDDALVGASVRLFARGGGGVPRLLPSPAVYPTANLMRKVAAQDEIAACLQLGRTADTVLFSPGSVDSRTILIASENFSEDDVSRLKEKGAVAVVGNRLVNREGDVADEQIDSRTLGVSIDELRNVRLSVAVGVGSAKWPAFKAVLRGKLANAIVTDSRTAEHLLSQAVAF